MRQEKFNYAGFGNPSKTTLRKIVNLGHDFYAWDNAALLSSVEGNRPIYLYPQGHFWRITRRARKNTLWIVQAVSRTSPRKYDDGVFRYDITAEIKHIRE
jgi:hypothetical protein